MDNQLINKGTNKRFLSPEVTTALAIGTMALVAAMPVVGILVAAALIGGAVISVAAKAAERSQHQEQAPARTQRVEKAPVKDVTPARVNDLSQAKVVEQKDKGDAQLVTKAPAVKTIEAQKDVVIAEPKSPASEAPKSAPKEQPEDNVFMRSMIKQYAAELALTKALLVMETANINQLSAEKTDAKKVSPLQWGLAEFSSVNMYIRAACLEGKSTPEAKVANEEAIRKKIAEIENNLQADLKSFNFTLSEKDIQDAIDNTSKYNHQRGKTQSLADFWPDLITKAKEITAEQYKPKEAAQEKKTEDREELVNKLAGVAIDKAIFAANVGPSTSKDVLKDESSKLFKKEEGEKWSPTKFDSRRMILVALGLQKGDARYSGIKNSMMDKATKDEMEAQEKAKGLGISQDEILVAIDKQASLGVRYYGGGKSLNDLWPEIAVAAKEIVRPKEQVKDIEATKNSDFAKILTGLSAEDAEKLQAVKSQVQNTDHSVQQTEAPKLSPAPRASGLSEVNMQTAR